MLCSIPVVSPGRLLTQGFAANSTGVALLSLAPSSAVAQIQSSYASSDR
jgi:hypothetical protein